MGGEQAEEYFCDNKSLSMPTLRMTAEAKNQLRDLLVNAGFPEECLTPQVSVNLQKTICMHNFILKVLNGNMIIPIFTRYSTTMVLIVSWIWLPVCCV